MKQINHGKNVFGKIILVFIFIVCCQGDLFCRDDLQFIANVDKNRVTVNDQVELSLTVTGTQEVGEPELPEFKDFEVLSRSSSSSFRFINGKMSVSKSYYYILLPLKTGQVVVPPARINVGNRTLKTEPIEIEVYSSSGSRKKVSQKQPTTNVSGGDKQLPATSEGRVGDRLFIELAVDKTDVYVGEQLTMSFRLYIGDIQISDLNYAPPVTSGFITESMGKQREYVTVKNGQRYRVIEIKTALFPVSSGKTTIEPASLQCSLLLKNKTSRRRSMPGDDFFDSFFDDSFFGGYQKYPVELNSKSVEVDVKPLPTEGKPDSFTGAVGDYDMKVQLDETEVQEGNPINMKLQISGEGNINGISPPVIKRENQLKVYEPESSVEIISRDPFIKGEKKYNMLIVPKSTEIKKIPEITFSYFNPQTERYERIEKGPFPITVLPGSEDEGKILEFTQTTEQRKEKSKKVSLLEKNIQYIMTDPGSLQKENNIFYRKYWFWLLFYILPVILLPFLLFYKNHKIKLKEDISYMKIRSAGKVVNHQLKLAEDNIKKGYDVGFYDCLGKSIEGLLEYKLNLSRGTVSDLDYIKKISKSKNIKHDMIIEVINYLEKCNAVRFGGIKADKAGMQADIQQVSFLLKKLRKKL